MYNKKVRPHTKKQITVIIPAYNEAKNILNILNTVKLVDEISEIIVVDDGSSDNTTELAQSVNGIKVISLEENIGKTKVVIKGVQESKYETLIFLDADLINLKKRHIVGMIKTYNQGYDMVLMDKGNQPWVFKTLLKSIPAESGTRILSKETFNKIPFRDTDRFQLEVRINDYFLENNFSIGISPADEVSDPRKFVKYSFLKGLMLDIKGGLEVLASDGLGSICKNLTTFRKISSLK